MVSWVDPLHDLHLTGQSESDESGRAGFGGAQNLTGQVQKVFKSRRSRRVGSGGFRITRVGSGRVGSGDFRNHADRVGSADPIRSDLTREA